MENASEFAVSIFSKAGRVYGLFIRIRGRATILGATERGIFYRIGVKVTQTKPGRWNAFFGVRTSIGIAELMIKKWMKDDVVVIHSRGARIRGSLHFSRTGIISFIGGSKLVATDAKANQQFLPAIDQISEGDSIDGY